MSSSLTATSPPKRIVHFCVRNGWSPFTLSTGSLIDSRCPSRGQSPKACAQHHHDDDFERSNKLKVVGAEKLCVVTEQDTGDAGQRRANDKGQHFIAGSVDAHCFGRQLVLANRHQGTADV